MNKPILEILNLSKKFGNFYANKKISFCVFPGERIGIVGANGSGKTTLVEQIIGISKPTSGKIKYYFKYRNSPQEKMGMQFQESSYPEGLSVKDIIQFSMNIYGVKLNDEELRKILTKFQVIDFYKAKAKSLSGGQQQKLNVLLAIIHKPKIVILDEISTGLDISARKEIIQYVDVITRENKTTTILISHNMNEIEKLCKRVIVLNKGEIVSVEEVKLINQKYGSLDEYVTKFLEKNKYENN